MRNLGNEICLFPGDWIEFISREETDRWTRRVGKIKEILDDGELWVEMPYQLVHVSVKDVIQKFSKFCILPIPGKEENKNERNSRLSKTK